MTRIPTATGEIGFDERGRSNATPIVFLHGVGSDKSVWRPQLEQFGRNRRAIALDYPGYGESAFLADASRDDFAAAILAAMDALGIAGAHVCGLSLGGVIAIAMHHAAPERCASLILASSFATHPDGKGIHDRSLAASRAGGMRALAEQRAPLLLAASATDAMKREVIETMARIDPRGFKRGIEAVWLADQRDRVAVIAVPTLVIVGDEDNVTPPQLSRELHAAISGSRLEVLAGAGHIANLDSADAFNTAVETFIDEVERR